MHENCSFFKNLSQCILLQYSCDTLVSQVSHLQYNHAALCCHICSNTHMKSKCWNCSFSFCSQASRQFSFPLQEVVATVSCHFTCFVVCMKQVYFPSFFVWSQLMQGGLLYLHNSPSKSLSRDEIMKQTVVS